MSASLPPDESPAWDARTAEAFQALRDATAPTSADVARLRARIAEAPGAPERWPVGAAAGTLVLLAGVGLWLALGPQPLQPSDVHLGDTLTVAGEQLALVDGHGEASLHGEQVRVDWVVGTIATDAGAAGRLVVATQEADWAVEGAGSLGRDRLGTHIADAPGAACAGDRVADTCLPVTPSGWLGRAHALVESGELSLAIEAFAAARDGARSDDALRSEAWAGLADALVRAGEVEDAAATAEQALADAPGTREMRLHMLAARAYLTLGDCGAALPHLQALPEPTAQEAAYIDHCEAQLRSPE